MGLGRLPRRPCRIPISGSMARFVRCGREASEVRHDFDGGFLAAEGPDLGNQFVVVVGWHRPTSTVKLAESRTELMFLVDGVFQAPAQGARSRKMKSPFAASLLARRDDEGDAC
jgi:hypothetical protein